MSTLDGIESEQHATRDENLRLHAQLTEQGESLKQQQSDLFKALLEADRYRSLYEVLRDEKLVGTSRKTVTFFRNVAMMMTRMTGMAQSYQRQIIM